MIHWQNTMLSILIPTYNYPISALVASLHRVLDNFDLAYEIQCLEDGSQLYVEENKAACDSYDHTLHIISEENKGRINSRKRLAQNAKYDWLLFLDADVEISNDDFIKTYSDYFDKSKEAIYGGCSYASEQPETSQLLRWKYGKAYEEVNSSVRNKTPYKSIVSANFLIKKHTFQHIISEIKNEGYGYDVFIGALMKEHKTKVHHIDNPVLHTGLDENSEYLAKVEKSVETNYRLLNEQKINTTQNSLLKLFKSLKRLGMVRIVSGMFNTFRQPIKRHLLGNSPNVKLLQFYKLGYLCAISLDKK
ncbi:glycosyltransferase family 2 protein [Winogradskyella tangerina]|uniref:glycosyltransferase family 2 protein n=1 Tax=Winogradskyella tangerina TaxID=2023240 RepID=UPI0013002F78|nr:glycosyltransferase family 2 protein [Winogradskyella tangerina]